jgi:RNA polymerase sigma factor (sigma-70 family)
MSTYIGGSVTRDAADLRSPDMLVREQAARRIWERFEPRLLELVRRRLNPRIRVREDEHDVLQSMFKSFFGMQPGTDHPPLASRGELWKFLVWMAMCKVANAAHKHQAHRRDVRREQPLGLPDFSDPRLEGWMAEIDDRGKLSPEEAAISREEFDRLLGQLPEPLQQIFLWRLQGYTNADIARMIDRTERTVELKMKIIRKTLERHPESQEAEGIRPGGMTGGPPGRSTAG